MGKLIVIEGLDGAGKATQTAKIYHWLNAQGERVRMISFPDYDNPSSSLVQMYLNGELGNTGDVNAYAASIMYAADRYISYLRKWSGESADGYIFTADRYTTSNIGYQMSKLAKTEWDEYLEWLVNFDYHKLAVTIPDLVI